MLSVIGGLMHTVEVRLPWPHKQSPSATRSFDSSTVEPDGTVTVTITAENYGRNRQGDGDATGRASIMWTPW